MARKLRRTVQHQYTPYIKSVPAKPGGVSKQGRVIPATPAQPAVPASSITETEQTYGGQLNTGISGDPQVVMVLLLVLFIVVTWKDLSSNLFMTIWDPSSKNDITKLSWGKYLGMIVFISIAVLLSLTSDEAAGLVLMVTLGVWTVYLIESNGGNVTSLFNWLTKISGNSQSQSK